MFSQTKDRIDYDLGRTESAIEAITGVRPRGFRGPGYTTSPALMDVLHTRAYDYDASSYPMSLGAIAAMYQRARRQNSLPDDVQVTATSLSVSFKQAWANLRPHSIHVSGLTELPVTTLPLLRFPIHFTYLNALADYSPLLARWYFRLALRLCSMRSVPPSLLLHAADFIGADDPFDMRFLPGMRRNWRDKIQLLECFFDDFLQAYQVTGLGHYLEQRNALMNKQAVSVIKAPR